MSIPRERGHSGVQLVDALHERGDGRSHALRTTSRAAFGTQHVAQKNRQAADEFRELVTPRCAHSGFVHRLGRDGDPTSRCVISIRGVVFFDQRIAQCAQTRPRVVPCRCYTCLEAIDDGLVNRAEELDQDRLLALEVVVDEPRGEPGLARDPGDWSWTCPASVDG